MTDSKHNFPAKEKTDLFGLLAWSPVTSDHTLPPCKLLPFFCQFLSAVGESEKDCRHIIFWAISPVTETPWNASNIAIQAVSVTKTTHTLHWIPLYLVDSVIQLLNNQGQYDKDFNMMGSCRSALFPTLQFFICFTWKLLAVSCLFFCSTLGPIIFSPRFQPPHCKTFCCLNKKNDVQKMIYFFVQKGSWFYLPSLRVQLFA